MPQVLPLKCIQKISGQCLWSVWCLSDCASVREILSDFECLLDHQWLFSMSQWCRKCIVKFFDHSQWRVWCLDALAVKYVWAIQKKFKPMHIKGMVLIGLCQRKRNFKWFWMPFRPSMVVQHVPMMPKMYSEIFRSFSMEGMMPQFFAAP
jgi:hypothetical protein